VRKSERMGEIEGGQPHSFYLQVYTLVSWGRPLQFFAIDIAILRTTESYLFVVCDYLAVLRTTVGICVTFLFSCSFIGLSHKVGCFPNKCVRERIDTDLTVVLITAKFYLGT